uniref:Methyltransferase domain-containing protein n=1 Tax=Rhodosorus marinus TaxID=101924 RepID=A0A7S0BNM5_9RHOD|mmetsp:Transcript_25027/g.36082  ORF Transcript_25027/g.36082 Transcript_25027/m.36082 type:complete len:198 (+) Transcript_25027:319-912(+)
MSGLIYRALIGAGQTTLGYKEALKRCRSGWKVLDVGTGDGFALLRNKDLIVESNLSIVCLEPDALAAKLLAREIAKEGLENQIKVRVEYLSHASLSEYDCCLCITTLVVFPTTEERRDCVDMCLSHVKPGGKVILHQTLYGGLNNIFLLSRYLMSFTAYHLYRPLFLNDLKSIFSGRLWDMESIHWLAPFMLFTVSK